MKAAVLREPAKPLKVEDVELRDPKPNEVLVRYVASGVCHTDLHFVQGVRPVPMPIILGHEGAGIVEKVGSVVTRVKPGDHIIANPEPFCGVCKFCATGRSNLCNIRGTPKNLFSALDGTDRYFNEGKPLKALLQVATFAEYGVIPQECAVPIRKDVPLEKVCLIGCGIMSGMGSVINRAKVEPGSSVVVIGCGGVGLNVVQGAVIAGAARIIAVDVSRSKLDMAQQMGATHVIDAARENVIERVRELTDGNGSDYAFEVVGSARTVTQAIEATHKGGTAVMIGLTPKGTQIAFDAELIRPQRTLMYSSFGSARQAADFPMLVDLYVSGKLKIDPLISKMVPLQDINAALHDLESGKGARTILKY